MDLKFVRDNVKKKMAIIKTKTDVEKWASTNNIDISPSNKDHVSKQFNEYMQEEIKKRIDDIIKVIGVYSFNYEISSEANMSDSIDNYARNGAIAGGLGGAGLILLLEGMLGPIGWIAAGLTAIGGYLFGQNKAIEKIIQTLYENAIKAQDSISSEIERTIDRILEKDNNVVENVILPNNLILSSEQLAIKKYIEERNIKYLVHFTNIKNIPTIKKYGLLSVNLLNKNNIEFSRNDFNRFDNYPDGISISITHINESLYNKFRIQNKLSEYVIIKIDPSILYLEPNKRIYCQTNAATTNGKKGESLIDFKEMFAEFVSYENTSGYHEFNRKYLSINETTDSQAEILWFDNVPLKYLCINDEWLGGSEQELLEYECDDSLEEDDFSELDEEENDEESYYNSKEYKREQLEQYHDYLRSIGEEVDEYDEDDDDNGENHEYRWEGFDVKRINGRAVTIDSSRDDYQELDLEDDDDFDDANDDFDYYNYYNNDDYGEDDDDNF